MKIQDYMITTIVLKLEKIKTQIKDGDKSNAIAEIDCLLENLERFDVDGSDCKDSSE